MSQSTLVDALRTIALLADKAVGVGVEPSFAGDAHRQLSVTRRQALALDAIHQAKGTKS